MRASKRINCRSHFGVARPLAMQKLLQDVNGLEANVDDLSARLHHSFAQVTDQVFDAMRHRREAVQSDLRRGTFYRVHRPEQAVDVFGIRIGFERQQAFGHSLQVLLRFRNEEFENFVRDVAILRQLTRQTTGQKGVRSGLGAASVRWLQVHSALRAPGGATGTQTRTAA